MRTASPATAKAKLSELICQAEKGEELLITHHGQLVVWLSPVEPLKRAVTSRATFRAGLPRWSKDSAPFVRAVRDEERLTAHYRDTRFITPPLANETTSAAVEAFVGKLAAGSLYISHWTVLEFASVIAREVRLKSMAETDARTVLGEFGALTNESLTMLMRTVGNFSLARDYIERLSTGLRSGDALHLAMAANRGAKKILTLDRGLLDAGRRLKLPATRGIKTERTTVACSDCASPR